ncbi:MAG TPA: FIST N-terminal domain-containing protein, partial [Solirubrobacterales bacterium]|nr:FIST N-terminal domain-containing protein [Solirubrobacterales bacterium]
MPVQIAVGVSESFGAVEAFSEAAAEARRRLDAPCDLCLVFAGSPHLGHGKWILSTVHEHLEPRHLIGCGAGGVVGAGREIEEGPAAVVWAASMPGAEVTTRHFEAERVGGSFELLDLPQAEELGEAMILLADPYSFPTEALLERLNELRPGMPVLGGLASASAAGSASLFRDGDVLSGGAVACILSGVPVLACVSQG